MTAFLAPSAQNRRTGYLRQAKIEHCRIVVFGLAQVLAILTVRSDIDGKILVPQSLRDLLRKKPIIFDQKNLLCLPN